MRSSFERKHKFIIPTLIIVAFFAVFIRFWMLGDMPSGSTPDESTNILNAYTIAYTLHDVNGHFLPLSFNFLNSFEPVPIYLISPFVRLFNLTLFSARLPFAIIGVATVLLVFFITKQLLQNISIAFFATFVIAFSPWHTQLSRIALVGPIALFFYLLGIYIFLRNAKSGNINWSLPAFLLGFHSYHATKIFMIIFIPILLFIYRDQLVMRKKELIAFIFGVILIVISFLFILKIGNINRQQAFITINGSIISTKVNIERTYNTAPAIIKTIFSNRLLTYFQLTRENYMHAFSPEYLFLSGEPGYNKEIYGLGDRGVLYMIELPLLILGIFYIFTKNKRIRIFLLLGLLIASLPSTFTIDKSYGMRSIMMLPFLTILIGCGIHVVINKIRTYKKILSSLGLSILALVYIFSITEYAYQYFFRYNVYGAESMFQSSRDVSEYIAKERNKYKQVLIANAGGLLWQYAIFNRENPAKVQNAYKTKQIDNIRFIQNCIQTYGKPFNPKTDLPIHTMYVVPTGCYKQVTSPPIYSIVQVGEPLHTIWDIYIH